MNEKATKLKEVLADEAFAQSVCDAQSAEEAQALLKEKGLEFSLEELDEIREAVLKMAESPLTKEQIEALANGELDEEALTQVAGGEYTWTERLVGMGIAAVGSIIIGTACYKLGYKNGWNSVSAVKEFVRGW